MALKTKILALALTGGTMLMATSCADDNLAKGLITGAGAAGGAWLGNRASDPEHKMAGTLIGAGAGGVLGYLLGGTIGKK